MDLSQQLRRRATQDRLPHGSPEALAHLAKVRFDESVALLFAVAHVNRPHLEIDAQCLWKDTPTNKQSADCIVQIFTRHVFNSIPDTKLPRESEICLTCECVYERHVC